MGTTTERIFNPKQQIREASMFPIQISTAVEHRILKISRTLYGPIPNITDTYHIMEIPTKSNIQ
jgi:hypothetical protein